MVTVVGLAGGASGGGFAEHGGGCPLTCRAGAGLPAPPLQAASTSAANTGSTEISRLQVRTGDRVPAAADAPRRDDQLIAAPLPDRDHAVAGRVGDVIWILMPSGDDPGLRREGTCAWRATWQEP